MEALRQSCKLRGKIVIKGVPGRRKAKPATEQAARLEHVRELREVQTLKDFHVRLTRAGGKWSYGAIRNYHSGVREYDNKRVTVEVPDAYLQKVAAVFAVSLDYLRDGHLPVTVEERKAAKEAERFRPDQAAENRVAMFRAFHEAAGYDLSRVPLFQTPDSLVMAAVPIIAEYVASDQPDGLTRYMEAARLLGEAIRAPIDKLGLHPERWPRAVRAQYLSQIIPALMPLAELEVYWAFAHAHDEENSDGEA